MSAKEEMDILKMLILSLFLPTDFISCPKSLSATIAIPQLLWEIQIALMNMITLLSSA